MQHTSYGRCALPGILFSEASSLLRSLLCAPAKHLIMFRKIKAQPNGELSVPWYVTVSIYKTNHDIPNITALWKGYSTFDSYRNGIYAIRNVGGQK